MKYYVVLDTNVVVSALFNISSVPGIILQEALAGRVIPLLHEDILDEYNDVLHRPKFKFDRRDIEIALTGLIKRGIFLDAAKIEDYVPDPDDAISMSRRSNLNLGRCRTSLYSSRISSCNRGITRPARASCRIIPGTEEMLNRAETTTFVSSTT